MEALHGAHKELYLRQIIHATMRFMKLIPAPLSTSKEDCNAQFSMLLPHFSHFQIDIQDGIYVPNKTIPLDTYLEVLLEEISLRQLSDRKSELITLDIHLMLQNYETQLQSIRKICTQLLNQHVEMRCIFVHSNIAHTLLEQYSDLPLGMTFSPPDKPKDWTEYLQSSKYAQVMTIFPGPQGQTFMPQMLEKVGRIHEINPHIQVCIDGSVNDTTYPVIRSSAPVCIPDELAVGSYFSKATKENIQSRIDTLSV